MKERVLAHRHEIHQTVASDLSKTRQQADITQIYPMVFELNKAIDNIKKWMRPVNITHQ